MSRAKEETSTSVRELSFFPSESIQVNGLVLAGGDKQTRSLLMVDLSVDSTICLVAHHAFERSVAWKSSFPENEGLFDMRVEEDVSVVGLSLPHFLTVLIVTLRGFVFIELSDSEDGCWEGCATSKEFSR